jgi:glycosyltransferase involved in cell wall biosynthesis
VSCSSLHFVVFSPLHGHGGGRETWLNNILPAIAALPGGPRIHVHYFSDATTGGEKIGAFSLANVVFLETRLPAPGGKWTSVSRIALFSRGVLAALRRHADARSTVIGVGTFYEGAVIRLAQLMLRPRPQLVIWIRGIWAKESSHRHGGLMQRLMRSAESWFVRAADKIIANGQDTRAHYEARLRRHVEAIPNALDLGKYASLRRAALSDPVKRVTYVGRLSEEKGLPCFLRSIDEFAARHSGVPVRFDIVGDGPMRALAEEAARRHPTLIRVIGPLRNEKIPSYLETVDAGVALTYSQQSGGGGVSNGLLELIGARRLVIAWDSVIFRQVLAPDQAAFVEERSTVALADAYASLSTDSALNADRIERSRVAIEPYSLDAHVAHMLRYLGGT